MPPRNPNIGKPRLLARPSLEALEDRTVLSSGMTLDLSSLNLDQARYARDTVLVQFRGTPQATVAGTALGRQVDPASGLYEVNLSAGVTAEGAVAAYRRAPNVTQADFDYFLTTTAAANDPRYGEQWSLRNTGLSGGKSGADIRASQAWDVTTGSTRMVISVNDTGVDYTHPDLYLNIWLNQGEVPASRRANLIDTDGDGLITFRDLNDKRNQGAGKITDLNGNGRIDGGDVLRPMVKDARGNDTGNGGWANGVSDDRDAWVDDLIGWNSSDNTNNPMDSYGHGTHVAGTIGAIGGNGVGVAGLNWKAQLMPIKFLDSSGNGTVSKFIAGLNYAVAHGAKISNNSWTGAGFSQMLLDAVNAAKAKGHIFVAAAGNAGLNNDVYPDYPSSLPNDNVVSVAATDRKDQLASFSNYGAASVDLAAPGVDVLSTTPNGGYGSNSGTSMATPHVTGVLALVWAQHPEWTYRQVINQVLNTVEKLPSLAGKTRTGGRLNAAAAVGAAQVSAVAPRIVSAVPQGASASVVSSVRVTFDRAMALSSFTAADVVLTGPGGRVIPVTAVKAVSGSGDRSFDVVFAPQAAVGAYTLKVGPNVTDARGVKMAAYQTTFKIAAPAPAAPRIVSAAPQGASASVVSSVRVTFDRAMALSSFTAADVVLTGPGGRVIPVTAVKAVSSSSGRAFDIVFSAQTAVGTYALKVGPNVSDLSGNRMAAYQTTFKIAAPAPAAPRIVSAAPQGASASVVSSVRVTFDRAMALSSFTAADVVLTGPGGRVIPVTAVKAVSGSGDRSFDVVFAPQAAVGAYTLKVGPNVTDARGVKMAAYQTTFKIAAPAPAAPRIVSAAPQGASASVVSSVRVTFDRAMALSSFTAADVVLTGPGGRVIAVTAVKAVSGSGDRSFDVVFAPQAAAGAYTLKVGPNVTDARGVKMAAYQTTFKIAAPAPAAPRVVSAAPTRPSTTSVTGVRVTFDRAVSLATFTTADATVTGPGGRAVAVTAVRVVSGSSNRAFDIVFASQTAAGTYTLKVGPNVTDAAGVKMASLYQTTFNVPAPVTRPPTTTTYTSTTAVNVPRGGRGVSMLTVGDSFTLADLNVKVNLSHSRISDLYIHLQAPDGTSIALFNRMGVGSANLTNTVFDDQAATIIGLGYGPFTGSFQPVVPLSLLNGKNVKGTWKLWVEDRGAHAQGTLLNWSITARPKV